MLDRTKGWAGRGIKGLESHTHLADLCRRVDILLDAIENGAIVGQENAISLTATTAEGFGLAPSRARSQRAGTLGGSDGRVGHPYCVVKGAFRSKGDGKLASSMLAIRGRRDPGTAACEGRSEATGRSRRQSLSTALERAG